MSSFRFHARCYWLLASAHCFSIYWLLRLAAVLMRPISTSKGCWGIIIKNAMDLRTGTVSLTSISSVYIYEMRALTSQADMSACFVRPHRLLKIDYLSLRQQSQLSKLNIEHKSGNKHYLSWWWIWISWRTLVTQAFTYFLALNTHFPFRLNICLSQVLNQNLDPEHNKIFFYTYLGKYVQLYYIWISKCYSLGDSK